METTTIFNIIFIKIVKIKFAEQTETSRKSVNTFLVDLWLNARMSKSGIFFTYQSDKKNCLGQN